MNRGTTGASHTLHVTCVCRLKWSKCQIVQFCNYSWNIYEKCNPVSTDKPSIKVETHRILIPHKFGTVRKLTAHNHIFHMRNNFVSSEFRTFKSPSQELPNVFYQTTMYTWTNTRHVCISFSWLHHWKQHEHALGDRLCLLVWHG